MKPYSCLTIYFFAPTSSRGVVSRPQHKQKKKKKTYHLQDVDAMLNGLTGLIVVINAFSNTDIGYYCTYSGVGGYTVKALLSSKGAICRCCRTATRNPFSPALLSLQDRCFYLSLSMEHYPILCSFSFHCLYPIIFYVRFFFFTPITPNTPRTTSTAREPTNRLFSSPPPPPNHSRSYLQ